MSMPTIGQVRAPKCKCFILMPENINIKNENELFQWRKYS